MYKSLFSLFILIIFSSYLFSQPPGNRQKPNGERPKIILKGIIQDQATNSGLEFATISIFSQRDSSLVGGGLSSLDGVFEFEVQAGKLYAEIEFIGYEKKVVENIALDREAIKNGNRVVDMGVIFVQSSALQMDEVTIQAEKSTNQFTLDKRVFNVGQDLANRGGTAEELLENVPSVTVDIDGSVSLRGSTGVRILINGKPSNLTTQQNGLKSIPSDMIESVEVITNPSARYEAEGMAGIINIILKKEKRSGFNGAFNSSISYPLGAGIGANVNYRKNKINWFANYNINYRSSPGGGFLNQEVYQGDSTFITDQTNSRNRKGLSNTLRGGIEYFFSEKQSLTGSIQYRISDDNNRTELIYKDYINTRDFVVSQADRTDNELEDQSGLQYNIDYYQEFKNREHTLRASFQYEDDQDVEKSDFVENNTRLSQQLIQRSLNDEKQNNYIFSVDYQQPLGSKDHKYEVGGRSSIRTINNMYLVEEEMDDIFTSLEQLSNDFNYIENIQALYAQYGNKFGRFGFQVGLRTEYANIITELVNSNIRNQRDSLNFFPSVFLNYEINEGNAIQTSYSRRIRRPNFRDLNPFYSYSDNRNFFSGNPFLTPEYTNSYEINYLKIWEDATLSSGIFYRHTNDVISRVRRINDEQLFETKPENLGFRDDFGFEVNGSYSFKDWLRVNGNVNFFRSITRSETTDVNLNADTYAVTSRLSSKFSFWKSDLQISGNLRTPRQSPQGRDRGRYSIDLGWSKDFLASKDLTLTLNVRDIFNSRKWNGETFGENFYTDFEYQWRRRTTTLSASYRINQKKQRGTRDRGDSGGGDFEEG